MYCVVQTGSRMLRLECGTTRRTFSCAGAAQAKPASSTAMRRLRGMRKSSGETTPQVSTGMRESVRLPLAFFASGAAALLFEVLWFRGFGRVVGNTVWAGALVLTAFMLGMALGGVLAARWAQKVRSPARAFAAAEATVAVAGTLLVWGLPELEALLGGWLAPLVEHSGLLAATRLAVSLAALLVPTTAMGMTLAFGVRMLAHRDTTRALGILYAANTFGACIAPLVAEYQLIGAIGLRGTALVAASLNALAALIALRQPATPVASPPVAVAPATSSSRRLLAAAAIARALA